MVAMKATIYHWSKYVQKFPQEVLWSFTLTHAVSLFDFCCVRAHVELRFECKCKCRMVLLFRVRYLHSCTARCDVMFLSIPFYKTKVIIILVFWCNCVKKLCICDRLTMHTWWESIWCRKNSRSCHNVMYNTDIIKILTLCVQMALSLRQDLNIIVWLASIGQPNMILYNPIFVLWIQ